MSLSTNTRPSAPIKEAGLIRTHIMRGREEETHAERINR